MVSKKQGGGGEPVSLEAFITSNWQILTIFGVFAGFTNYMNGLQNTILVTLGFLMTFIVELEILMLLLKIKNMSFLLRMFTVLSIAFIVIFAGFIYSNHLSSYFSAFGDEFQKSVNENRIFYVRLIFCISVGIILLGLYSRIHQALVDVIREAAGEGTRIRAGVIATLAVVVLAAASFILIGSAPDESIAKVTTTTTTLEEVKCRPPERLVDGICCIDANLNDICDEVVSTTTTTVRKPQATTTTTTLPKALCFTNNDCGNQTIERICYKGDVYLQKSTPLCQRPGSADARCIVKTALEGQTITSEASPHEKCTGRCVDGVCVD